MRRSRHRSLRTPSEADVRQRPRIEELARRREGEQFDAEWLADQLRVTWICTPGTERHRATGHVALARDDGGLGFSTSLPRTSPAATARTHGERRRAKTSSMGGRSQSPRTCRSAAATPRRSPSSPDDAQLPEVDMRGEIRWRLTTRGGTADDQASPGRRLRIEWDQVALPTVSITHVPRGGAAAARCRTPRGPHLDAKSALAWVVARPGHRHGGPA